jgi:hypothetical protein
MGQLMDGIEQEIIFQTEVIHYSIRAILTYIDRNPLLIMYQKDDIFGQRTKLINHDYREWIWKGILILFSLLYLIFLKLRGFDT